jgi:hypothetical protein
MALSAVEAAEVLLESSAAEVRAARGADAETAERLLAALPLALARNGPASDEDAPAPPGSSDAALAETAEAVLRRAAGALRAGHWDSGAALARVPARPNPRSARPEAYLSHAPARGAGRTASGGGRG